MLKTLLVVLVLVAVLSGCGQQGELVENGVQSVTLCGKKKGTFNRSPILNDIMEVIPNAHVGTWYMDEQGDCNVWYHQSGTD